MGKQTGYIRALIDYLGVGIWRVRIKDMPSRRSFMVRQLRIFLLTLRGFDQDKCQLRASSLTFYTLLSIVPIVAVAFGVAKGFGLEKVLEGQIIKQFAGQEEVMTRVIEFSKSLLQTTKGGAMAGIGVVILFWSVTKVLRHIEWAFNDIWEIKKARPIGRRLSNYLTIILISPVILILSGSATVFITSELTGFVEKTYFPETLVPLFFFSLKILPYCMIWGLLTFVYYILPNTRVHLKSAFVGGVLAGTAYQITQLLYINFQIGIAKYNAIYGSFAALPMFLIWLELSWLIILFGAEFSFASQNVDTYEYEPDCRDVSSSLKRLISLNITHSVVKNFSTGGRHYTAEDIGERFELPIRLTRDLLFDLVESGILIEVITDDVKEPYYQPAMDIGLLTIEYVTRALDERGTDTVPIAENMEFREIKASLAGFREMIIKSPSNRLLKDI